MPNRLVHETSPYLLQHAENPVDWYPWGPDALGRARAEGKPILLSIGYAACHWCHVMAHESFENAATAQLMNERFVNVKVDREERPDLDSIYMQAVQAMTGHGGWPMTVFLTPAGEPFYGGTYFPPEDRHGMPSFTRILRSVAEAWETNRDQVSRAVEAVREVYAAAGASEDRGPKTENRQRLSADPTVARDVLERATRDLSARFEPMMGGFGGAPKFPHTMALDFLLRRWARTGDERALHIARHSFEQMVRGGIFDQIGGGFHRYSVDARWLVPHFEKMLYDNALLVRFGAHLWQVTRSPEIRRVTEATLDWVLREMTDASGGWYSSLDADSEHEEGKFYVWTPAEITAVLGADAPAAIAHWNATDSGNFEGANILFVRPDATGDEPAAAGAWRGKLLAERVKRVWPGRDEKILASWNGLMLRAMAECARIFGRDDYAGAAKRNADFLWRELVRDGRVYRTHTRGETRIAGYLEDYASLGLAFVAMYQLTFERVWLDRAMTLCDACVEWFYDSTSRSFYDTARDAEALVTRPRDVTDNATPAGQSLAAELLLMKAEYYGDSAARKMAAAILDDASEPMARYSTMFGHLLGAADMEISGAIGVAIAGDPSAAAFRAMTRALGERYVPGLVLAGGIGERTRGIALMEGRDVAEGRAAAYVCRNYVCALPAETPDALKAQL